MSSFDTTASRFLRPNDVARPRNQRRIQTQRILFVLRNVLLAMVLAAGGVWGYLRTQSDARFAVRTIEVVGAVHTSAEAIDIVTSRYVGLNLFKIDIARVQNDLGGLAWVSRIDIEKKLPDTLRIKIAERKPVALVRSSAPADGIRSSAPADGIRSSAPADGIRSRAPIDRIRAGDRLLYADEQGVAFAELSPAAGNDDLPLIAHASGAELVRTIAFLTDLRMRDPHVYARISEIRPVPPRGFAVFDRQIQALVYVNADDVSAKWRNLYSILDAERRPPIAYADLRFADRVVIKPSEGAPHVQN